MILAVRAFPDGDDEVVAVFCDIASKAPFLLVCSLINKLVFGLRCPDLVKIQFLEVIGAGELFAFLRLVITAVIEARVVVGPGST